MAAASSDSVRKDSARNRAKLVEAAREVFAERGFEATLADIAKHAGVGTGTAYRHFPNKQAVAAVVLADATEQIAADARSSMAIGDPWTALVTFFELTAARQAEDRGLYEALTGQGDYEEQARIWPKITETVVELFQRALDAGAIRQDAAPQDIAAIFAMLGAAYEMSDAVGSELWRRYLALLLDGLRATDRPAIPVPPASIEQVNDLLQAGKHRRSR
jgi:AcrR family transcriptional regulator